MNSVFTTFITELEALVQKWGEKTWPPENDVETAKQITQSFDNLCTHFKETHPAEFQLDNEDEPYDQLLPHLQRYSQHPNWKIRACGVLFLGSELRQFYDYGGHPDYVHPNDLFFLTLNDPNHRVVEFMLHTYHAQGMIQIDPSDPSLGGYVEYVLVNEVILHSIDLAALLGRLPEIHSQVRAYYFWLLVALTYYDTKNPERTYLLKEFITLFLQDHSDWNPWKVMKDVGKGDEFIHFWLKLPPGPNELEWAQTLLKMLRTWRYDYDNGYSMSEMVKIVHPVLLRLQDLDLLLQFLNHLEEITLNGFWRDIHDGLDFRNHIFNKTIQVNWLAGARHILMDTVFRTSGAYISDIAYADQVTHVWATINVNMIRAYLDAGGEISFPLLRRLYILWKYTHNAAMFGFTLPAFETILTRIGKSIEQQGDRVSQAYCQDRPFFFPLQGMLEISIATKNLDRECHRVSLQIRGERGKYC